MEIDFLAVSLGMVTLVVFLSITYGFYRLWRQMTDPED